MAGLIFYVLSVQAIGAAGVGAYVYLQGGDSRDLLLPIAGAVLAMTYAIVGYFLRRYFVWARNFAFVFSAIGVFFFPVGTVIGALIMLSIDRANRAGLFPKRGAMPEQAEAEELGALLRLEPDFSTKSAG